MIDAGGKASLAPETLTRGRVGRALLSEYLHGDRPFQLLIERREDHAHATLTQRVGHTVSANTRGYIGDSSCPDTLVEKHGRPLQKGRGALMRGEQLFNREAQRRVVVAGCSQVRRPTLRRQRARALEHFLQAQPVFSTKRRHTSFPLVSAGTCGLSLASPRPLVREKSYRPYPQECER